MIGLDPNVLHPGTLLYVPHRCTSSSNGVYDPGTGMYANGTVTGNVVVTTKEASAGVRLRAHQAA